MAIGPEDFLQDVLGAFCPDTEFRILVVMNDVFINGSDQFGHAGEYATAQLLDGDVQTGALNRIGR